MIKKIRVDDLEVGMFVQDFNVPWMDHPFLTSKKKLRSANDIDQIKELNIEEIYIDTDRGRDSSRAVSAAEAGAAEEEVFQREVAAGAEAEPQGPDADPVSSFEVELVQAQKVYADAKDMVKGLLHDVRMGHSIDGERAVRTVDQMVDSILRNPDALSSLSRLKSFDDYTFQHSLNVSVMSLALGRHIGFDRGELRRLGIGAILHDLGKMRIPEKVLNKPGRLTEKEFELMKTHPLHGAKILMETKEVPDDSAAVALNHHERFNGKGYPRGLEGMEIGEFGLISAIVDVYDAVTSDRVYHKGMESHRAMQKIFEWSKTDFYPAYVHTFIQCMGIYPVGSVVALDTGEVGVVYRQRRGDLLRPTVRLVRGADGSPLSRLVDVEISEIDPAGDQPFLRSVKRSVSPKEAGVDVEAVLADGRQEAA